MRELHGGKERRGEENKGEGEEEGQVGGQDYPRPPPNPMGAKGVGIPMLI